VGHSAKPRTDSRGCHPTAIGYKWGVSSVPPPPEIRPPAAAESAPRPVDPAPAAIEPSSDAAQTERAEHQLVVPRTRTSSTFSGIGIGLVVLLGVIVFIAQNTGDTRLNFLWIHGSLPVGLAVLLAFVLGGIFVLLLGVARLTQLRLVARRHRRGRSPG
jgi:uncharacterized integral membrane protein